jgi:hypothetical protein
VSSIPEVIGRESGRKVAVLSRAIVRDRLATEVARGRQAGVDVFVVDAESDDDVGTAVTAILALGRPLCLVGSIALAAAGRASRGAAGRRARGRAEARVDARVDRERQLAHPRARAGRRGARDGAGDRVGPRRRPASFAAAAAALARGTTVVLAPAAASSVPTPASLRATETALADTVAAIAAATPIATLVLIGGETSYAVLTRLQAGAIAVHGASRRWWRTARFCAASRRRDADHQRRVGRRSRRDRRARSRARRNRRRWRVGYERRNGSARRHRHGGDDRVSGELTNGDLVDSTDRCGPVTYLHGNEQIFPALEQAVDGLVAGEERRMSLSPRESYGEHRPDLVRRMPRRQLPSRPRARDREAVHRSTAAG